MIRYSNGKDVRVGDLISIDAGVRKGTVEHVVESPEDVAAFGVGEPGIMVTSEFYGRVYITISKNHDDEVTLLSRKEEA